MDTTVAQAAMSPLTPSRRQGQGEARGQPLAAYRDLLAREAQAPPIEDVMVDIASVSRSITPSRICGRSPSDGRQ